METLEGEEQTVLMEEEKEEEREREKEEEKEEKSETISREELIKQLKKLKIGKTSGEDGLENEV